MRGYFPLTDLNLMASPTGVDSNRLTVRLRGFETLRGAVAAA